MSCSKAVRAVHLQTAFIFSVAVRVSGCHHLRLCKGEQQVPVLNRSQQRRTRGASVFSKHTW
jgi:hypothetical protein